MGAAIIRGKEQDMTVDELIELLEELPQDIRSRPIVTMDGDNILDYRHLTVNTYIVGDDGACLPSDPEMDAEDDARETSRVYGEPMHAERRATLQP